MINKLFGYFYDNIEDILKYFMVACLILFSIQINILKRRVKVIEQKLENVVILENAND